MLRPVVAASATLLAACLSQTEVHPDYGRLAPSKVCVLPVVNKTVYQLDVVSYGGLIQRALIGAESTNIPEILQASAQEALILKGYATRSGCASPALFGGKLPDFSKPLPAGAPSQPFDAVCRLTVEEWSSDALRVSDMHMVYTIELFRVPTAERLFFGRFGCGYREEAGSPPPEDMAIVIRRSVRGALDRLPVASE